MVFGFSGTVHKGVLSCVEGVPAAPTTMGYDQTDMIILMKKNKIKPPQFILEKSRHSSIKGLLNTRFFDKDVGQTGTAYIVPMRRKKSVLREKR